LTSIGNIHTLHVEVYGKDIKVREGQKFLDWGTVYPGTLTNYTFNVTSRSNIQAKLIIKAINWTFYNSQNQIVKQTNETNYVILISTYNETLMDPKQTIQVILTLKVIHSDEFIDFLIENDIQTFSFDIRIYLTEKS